MFVKFCEYLLRFSCIALDSFSLPILSVGMFLSATTILLVFAMQTAARKNVINIVNDTLMSYEDESCETWLHKGAFKKKNCTNSRKKSFFFVAVGANIFQRPLVT